MEYFIGDTPEETEQRVSKLYDDFQPFFSELDIVDGKHLFEVLSWNIPTKKPADESHKVTITAQFHIDLINRCVHGYTADVQADTDVSKMLGEDCPVVETVFAVVSTDVRLHEQKSAVNDALWIVVNDLISAGLWPANTANSHNNNNNNTIVDVDDDDGDNAGANGNNFLSSTSSSSSSSSSLSSSSYRRQHHSHQRHIEKKNSDISGDFQICDPSLRGVELVQHCTHSTIYGLFIRVSYVKTAADKTAKSRFEAKDNKHILFGCCYSFFQSLLSGSISTKEPLAMTLVGHWKTNTVIDFGTRFTVFNGCGYSRSTNSPWCLWDPASGLLSCYCRYNMFEKDTLLGNASVQAGCVKAFVSSESAPQFNIYPVITACHTLFIPEVLEATNAKKHVDNRSRYWAYTDESVGVVDNIGKFWWTRAYESIDDDGLVEVLFKPVYGLTTMATPLQSQITLEEIARLGRITDSNIVRIDADNSSKWTKALAALKNTKTITMDQVAGKYLFKLSDIKL